MLSALVGESTARARLMSPSDDFGEMLKPFVFLDFLDHDVREPITSGLHPHSGIATVSHLTEGSVNYIDPDNVTGILPAGGVEWMQAGRGMWHGGSIDAPGRMRGFQLWIALPPHLELGPTISIYQPLSASSMCARNAGVTWGSTPNQAAKAGTA